MLHYQQIDPVENAQVSALCMEVLKEGVRASEARFEEMNSAKIELERKAQWLAAFCLGALIFLFKDLTGVIFWEAAIRFVAIIFLGIAAAWFAAVSSLDLMFYGNRGLIPAVVVSDWLKKQDKSEQLPHLLYHLLSEYNKRIAQSDESNRKKRNVFSGAKKCLAIGVSLTASVILLPFLAEAVPKAQAWLCGL